MERCLSRIAQTLRRLRRWACTNSASFFGLDNEAKTATELAAIIKEQAILSLGPWPEDLQLMILGRGSRWSCGLSPTIRTSYAVYREGVLQIARALQKVVSHKPGS
jgi:hypothetical protein